MSVVPELLHERADEMMQLLTDRRPFTFEYAITQGTIEIGKGSPPHSFAATCRAAFALSPVGWLCVADHDCDRHWPNLRRERHAMVEAGVGL